MHAICCRHTIGLTKLVPGLMRHLDAAGGVGLAGAVVVTLLAGGGVRELMARVKP